MPNARNTFFALTMPKRSHLVLETDDFQDVQISQDERVPYSGRSENTTVLLNLLRLVLTRHGRDQKIRKDHLSPILHRHNLKGNIITWINALRKEFEELFGITLLMSGNEIVVKSNLQPSSRCILDQLLMGDEFKPERSSNLNGSFQHLASHKRHEIIVNTPETILGGVIMLIVSLIVVNENHMRENDLFDVLNEFGLSENLSSVVANLNKSTQDILSDLVRREYVGKIITGKGRQNSQVDFCLGKTTLREIEPRSILKFLKNMVDRDEMHMKCIASVQRCFPDAILSEDLTRE